MNILVVEDDPALQTLLTAAFLRAGHQVFVTGDGDEALRVYEDRGASYDLVLTDIWHSGVDGIELAGTIRKVNPAQPIAFQTGIRVDKDLIIRERMATFGVSNLPRIEKPFQAEQLLQFVQSMVGKAVPNTDE